jgi:ribosome-associated protein
MSAEQQSATAGGAELDAEQLANRIAEIASDRKAIDIRIIDVRGLVSYTDYLVVCSGNTERQTSAIRDAIHKELKDDHGLMPRRAEGASEARWILLDYLDCVVHVFTPDARDFYRLDKLWGDAPQRTVE